MKIIVEGTRPENKVFKHTCKECGTVFEFQRKEATFVESLDSRELSHLFILCPVCSKGCYIYKDIGYFVESLDSREVSHLFILCPVCSNGCYIYKDIG
jgi:hypothetical protein